MSSKNSKIKTLDELFLLVRELKSGGKKIVHCHGVFDLLHVGHVRHLEAAKREGDILVVTLTRDEHVCKGPGRPVFNQRLRVESVTALQCVDYVALNEGPKAVETIKKLEPDVYCKGSDYSKREDDLTGGIYEEETAVKSVGGRIHFTKEITFSSTELLNAHFQVYPEQTTQYVEEFRRRYSSEYIIGELKALKRLKILVIGDTIIDEYHYCQPLGKVPKEVAIAAKYVNEERFAGGALATANHIAGFCENVHLVTSLGAQDSYEDFILSHLKSNIKTKFFYCQDAPTVVKRRFVQPYFLSKMFEICYLDDHDLPEPLDREVCDYLEASIPDYDLVLVNDFGHGFIGERIIHVLSDKARFLAVNTQTNTANAGFNLVTRYPRADFICLDEPEIRLASRNKFGSLENSVIEIAEKLQCGKVIITQGQHGALTYASDGGFTNIPVFSEEVVDRTGAGDAFLSVASLCIAAGYPVEMAGFVGNAVGALAVLIVCNKDSVEPVPLFKFITAILG